MQGVISWFNSMRAEKSRQAYLTNLEKRWRRFIWDWHKPLQMESITAREPLFQLIDAEKEKSRSGKAVDKTALQQEFLNTLDSIDAIDRRISAAFCDWLASEDAKDWKEEMAAAGVMDQFIGIAAEIVLTTSRNTLDTSIVLAKDIIDGDELCALAIERAEQDPKLQQSPHSVCKPHLG